MKTKKEKDFLSLDTLLYDIEKVMDNKLPKWRMYSSVLDLLCNLSKKLLDLKQYLLAGRVLENYIKYFDKIQFPENYCGLNELRYLLFQNWIKYFIESKDKKPLEDLLKTFQEKKIDMSPFPDITIFKAELLCCENKWDKALHLLESFDNKDWKHFIELIKNGMSPLGENKKDNNVNISN